MKTDEKTGEYAERITAALVAAIEAAGPESHWALPWHNVAAGTMRPKNPATGAEYTGANAVGLWFTSQMLGAPNYWATFKQWQTIGATVRKGEHAAARALRPMQRTMEDAATGDKITRTIGFTSFAVFHAGQVDGWEVPAPIELPAIELDTVADIEHAYSFVRRCGARLNLVAASRAFYSPSLDTVTLPTVELWKTADAAWSTACHELTHWTGHESRLAREFGKRFGDDAYAVEELTAELGSAFVLAAIGRHAEPRDDHAQYLASWLRVLKSDPTALFAVAAKSEKATQHILSLVDMEPARPRELVAA